MAFRFRKSFKIAPGIRLNVGKNGLSSVSMGPRGASISVGKQGTYANVGLAGTGISVRKRIDRKTEQTRIAKVQEKLERLEKMQEALAKVKLSLDEKGSINALNSFGEPLSRSETKLMWEQQADTIGEWLQNRMDEINGDIDLLENIYQDTPDPNNFPEYIIKKFDEPKPKEPYFANKPQKGNIPTLGFFTKFFQSKRDAHQRKIEEIETAYKESLKQWNEKRSKALHEYEAELKNWEERKEKFDKKEIDFKKNFSTLIKEDVNSMEQMLEDVLNNLSWPRETLISYEIEDNGKEIWVDIDLPEIEDLPQKVATIASTGRKLNIKNKAKKQLQLEYANHIYGIAFRVSGTIFATLPSIQKIILSGYSQRLDQSTGKINDEYLYSYKVDKDGFTKIDFDVLERVNPMASMDTFYHRKKMTATGIFKAIEPFTK